MGTNRQFGNVRKLPSGRYQVRYRKLGRLVPGDRTFKTKADANVFLAQVEADMARGTFIDPTVGQINFERYAKQWLDQRDLRPRTRETYQSQLRYLVAEFGRATLADITPTDVRSWHGKLNRSQLHSNTVAKIYRLMRTIMTTAVDDGLLPTNPVHIRGASKEETIERPLLTWDEVEALADAIHPKFFALVWLAAGTGLRFGELVGLTRDRVDLDGSTVQVDKSLAFEKGKGATLGRPKTVTSYRTVSVPREIMDLVEEYLVDHGPSKADGGGLVFTSVKNRPLINRHFAPFWRRARLAVGRPDVRFHDLRHFAGTEAASSGASLREVMHRMGHSTSDASLRYLKASEQRDREIADSMSDRLRRRA